MTREEAITILIREKDEDPFMRTEYREQIHEALNMAIKALNQETIPISWLKEKLKNHPELSYVTTDSIINVLDLWGQKKEV